MISTTSWASCWLAFSRISRRARALKKKPDTIKFSVKSLKKKPCWGLRLVKLRKNGQQKRATNSEKRVEKICLSVLPPTFNKSSCCKLREYTGVRSLAAKHLPKTGKKRPTSTDFVAKSRTALSFLQHFFCNLQQPADLLQERFDSSL